MVVISRAVGKARGTRGFPGFEVCGCSFDEDSGRPARHNGDPGCSRPRGLGRDPAERVPPSQLAVGIKDSNPSRAVGSPPLGRSDRGGVGACRVSGSLAVEDIIGRIGHFHELARDSRPGIGGGVAAHGVQPLDKRHPVEDTGAMSELGHRPEQQPGDGVGVRESSGRSRSATTRLPLTLSQVGPPKWMATAPWYPASANKHRLGGDEDPAFPVPLVVLRPQAEQVGGDLVPGIHPERLAVAQVRDPAVIEPRPPRPGTTSTSRVNVAIARQTGGERNGRVSLERVIFWTFLFWRESGSLGGPGTNQPWPDSDCSIRHPAMACADAASAVRYNPVR